MVHLTSAQRMPRSTWAEEAFSSPPFQPKYIVWGEKPSRANEENGAYYTAEGGKRLSKSYFYARTRTLFSRRRNFPLPVEILHRDVLPLCREGILEFTTNA